MAKEAKSDIMREIESLREVSGISKTEMTSKMKSRSRYYEHLEADDLKFSIVKEYLDRVGCDLIARNRKTGFEKKL